MTLKTPLFALLAFALAACGSDRPYTCKVDDDLLDLAQECFLDEDCPCGAHCDMGVCGYECTSNRDCDAGTTCDAFGRCSEKKSPAHALPPSAAPSGALQLSRTGLLFTGAGDIRTLSLRATQTASGPIRVKAGPDVEVQCPGDANFGVECRMDSQSPDAQTGAVLSVRATASVPADQPNLGSRIDFWSKNNGHTTAGVTLVNVDYTPTSGGNRSATTLTEPGLYRGSMTLVGIGTDSGGTDVEFATPGGETPLEIPVEIEVQPAGNSALVRLDDATGAVFNGTVLSLDKSVSVLDSVWLPVGRTDARFLDYGQVAQIQVNQAVSMSDYVWLNGAEFKATMVTSYSGLTVNASPALKWVVLAERLDLDISPAELLPTGENPLDETAVARQFESWPVESEMVVTNAMNAMCPDGFGAQAALATTPDGDALAAGDLACDDGRPAPTFPVIETQRSSDTTIATVNQCLDELSACNTDACPAPDTRTCVDPQRVLAGALHGFSSASTTNDRKIGHRLLQQWLTTHAWLATEAHGAHRREVILADNVGLEDDLVGILADSLSGWDPLLHPKVADGLLGFEPETLANPDYRCAFIDCATLTEESDFHVQPQGLPVTILSVLSNQANALERSYEHVQFLQADGEQVDEVARDYLRRALLMRAYAQGLKEHADAASGGVPWQPEWELESDRFTARLGHLFDRMTEVDNGVNPLGIEEIDLPLYGVGDETNDQDRFFALSDYLLGVGSCTQNTGGLAWSACRDASVSFDRVRDAFLDEQDRAFDYAQYLTTRGDRKLALENEYGAAIIALCGWPASEYDISYVDVFDFIDTIDPNVCFQPGGPFIEALGITDSPNDCGQAKSDTVTASAAEIGNAICQQAELSDLLPSYKPGCEEPLNELWRKTDYGTKKLDYLSISYDGPYTFYTFDVDGDDVDVPYDCFDDPPGIFRFKNSYNYVAELDEAGVGDTYDAIRRAQAVCEEATATFDVGREGNEDGACDWTQDCPLSQICQNGTCQAKPPIDSRPECYRGSLGAVQLSVAASAVSIRTAKQELDDHVRRYDIAVESCTILAETNDKREERTQAFNDAQEALRAIAATADGVAAVSDQVAQSTSLTGFLSGGARAVTAAAQVTSITMKASMETAKDKHELAMLKLENGSAEAICYNNANAELVGVQAQTLRIEQAMLDMQRQLIEFENLKEGTRDLIGSYRALYERELTMPIAPMVMDGWQDAEIDRYHRKMREAKRQAWLAMRALEYETQGGSQFGGYRDDILAARTPFDLEIALQDMQSALATGTVNGGSAGQLLAVISFRDDVLQLLDQSDLDTESHDMTPEQRLQHILTSDAYAYTDASGNYAGQRIPFTLAPIANLEDNSPIVIPLRTATDCAERLWSVSASLIGPDLNPGSDTTFSRVLVEKSNTFSSQWCAPENRDSPMQTAHTRPLRNLFADPQGEDDPYATAATATDFTRARISAYYEVTRAEMEDEAYYNGDSLELAGRGLYGEYALLFPVDEIRTSTTDADAPGLDLSHVDDVLLRFDYVSVAQ